MAERPGIAGSGPNAPGVLVVYGLKTDDYGWLAGFYPARRIAEACENRGISLRFLFPGDVPAFLAGQAFLAGGRSRCGAIGDDRPIALVRGVVEPDTYAILEAAGYRCVNDSRAVALARDKLEAYEFLAARGYPTPMTWAVNTRFSRAGSGARGDSEMLVGSGAHAPPFPVVVKPRFGSRGVGVSLAHDAAELAARVDAGSRVDGGSRADGAAARVEYVAQEYIESSKGRDVRAFFAGGDVIAVAERTNGAGELRSNACAGGETRLVTDGRFARWEAMTLDIARDAGLWYGTVDWLFLPDGNMTVCEINSSPGFEALEKCGIDVAGAIVDALARGAR